MKPSRGWIGAAVAAIATAALWMALRAERPTAAADDDAATFARYAGSASCRDCHAEQFTAWQGSHHGLAERAVDPSLDRAAFEPERSVDDGAASTTVRWSDGHAEVATVGLSGKSETHAVARAIGHDPLRQFLVPFPDGRFQTLAASFDPRKGEWFDVFGDEARRPGEWGHWTGRGMNWNFMCAACHNTRLRKNYDAANDRYRTTMAEVSVGCEACHGPLRAHAEWQRESGGSIGKDPTLARLRPEQQFDSCGSCHARRGDLTGDFVPGDDFFDAFRLTIVDESEVFHADGQVRDEDYEFAPFLGSRMHFRGVRCSECHDPHSAKTRLPGNWLCMKCHDGSNQDAKKIEPVAHSHHSVFGYDAAGTRVSDDLMAYRKGPVAESGGECVNCHMPQTTYMQRHARHDHGFTIPDPLLTKQAAIPNACNRCHADRNADWALAKCDEWYGAAMDRPSRKRTQTIVAARAGEPAALPALLALAAEQELPYWRGVAAGLLARWEREPAVAPALLRGLDDASALVRAECVRSLEGLAADGAADVVAALQRRLDDPSRGVRVAAAWALRASVDLASRAGEELARSLALQADQPVGQMQLGALALARGDAATALRHYQQAIEWDPGSAPFRHDCAVVLSGLGRAQEAVAQLEAACRLEPDNAEFLFKLGLAWNELGETAKSLRSLQAALALDPGHARGWYNFGLALQSTGESEEALRALSRAEALDARDPAVPYARATILAQLGRYDEARAAAESALQIDPRFTAASELLRRLP
jgi:predicted CXXCH cytochrome family protein